MTIAPVSSDRAARELLPWRRLLPAPALDADENSFDWQRYALAASRHRWVVLAVTVVGAVAGVIGTRYLEPRYSSKAMLWIEAGNRTRDPALISAENVVEPPAWADLVRSTAVLDSVVRRQRLFLAPHASADSAAFESLALGSSVRPGDYLLQVDRRGQRFRLSDEEGREVQRGLVGDSVGIAVGFQWAPRATVLTPGRELRFGIAAPYDVAQRLGHDLEARVEPGGSFLRIELLDEDPHRAAATLNAVADRVVTVAAELKRQKFEELSRILGGQYEHAEQALRGAEGALAGFRARHAGQLHLPTAALPDQAPSAGASTQQPLDLQRSLVQARRDRRAIAEVLRAAPREGLHVEALAAIPAVQQSANLSLALREATDKAATLRALRYRYTDQSAPVVQLSAELQALERGAIPDLSRGLMAELDARAAVLSPRLDTTMGYYRRLPGLALEELRLSRDVAGNEELFNQVRQRYEAARLGLASSLPDIRVLDRASAPNRPMANYAPLIIVMAVLTGFGLAVFGVTLRDQMDPRIYYPEQVTDGMRLTILGAVPHVRRSGTDNPDEVIEAVRGLRSRVLQAAGGGQLLVTVTSPASGDGKSFIAVNLALSFAYAGYRTLLVDGDVRRGAQHHALGGPRRPGLTDVLAGLATADDAIRRTAYANLSLLCSGTRMHRAPELLLSENLRTLTSRLRSTYGAIIVDSPPLSAGIDPLLLGTTTGNLLLVLRTGATEMPMAMSQLDAVDAMPVHLIGAVLNDVRGDGAFRYYTYNAGSYAPATEEILSGPDGRLPILEGRVE